ncbi:MAG: MBL fold metallo-hydrolase [Paracoccaceae bacterium]|nr:MBL fold metallo-hydrolase [Paracoccaceae bacterium]
MPTTPLLSRRQAMLTGAALPFAGAQLPAAAQASAPQLGPSMAQINRFKLGGFEVTALLAGTRKVPEPHKIFGLNVDDADFAKVSAQNFLPTAAAQFFFTPTLVNTGKELVLFDTGLNAAGITGALQAAGYRPDQVDVVVLTHMHPDHIGGMMADKAATFPKARYVTGRVEFDFYAKANNKLFDANVRPFADKMTYVEDGGTVAPGITAIFAPGHTPGHMAYHIESEGHGLLITADTANHYVWSLGYPDWEVSFDADKAEAAKTRRKIFGMLASDKMAFIGYHMPFPAMGYVETMGTGFRYVAASYQMML